MEGWRDEGMDRWTERQIEVHIVEKQRQTNRQKDTQKHNELFSSTGKERKGS